MSKPRKRWADHSPRWKREASRDGMTPQRWDRWLRLKTDVKAETDPRRYAAGVPIPTLIHEYLSPKATDRMLQMKATARLSTIAAGVEEMTIAQLRWTIKAPAQDISRRARRKYPPGERNPWWYN